MNPHLASALAIARRHLADGGDAGGIDPMTAGPEGFGSPVGYSSAGTAQNIASNLPGYIAGKAQGIGQGIYGAMTLPGDVYAGRADMNDPATQDRALNLAGMVSLPTEMGSAGVLRTGAGGVDKPIIAYHGSPHSFDQFSLDKIGTGEGAQAYGNGLYFAQSEGVAKSYRDALSSPTVSLDGQKVVPTPGSPEDIALAHLQDAFDSKASDPYAAAGRSLRMAKGNMPPHMQDKFAAAQMTLDDWNAMGAKQTPGGHMYQVAINANPDHFLDWDKPLSEQHPVVQEAAASLHPTLQAYLDGEYLTNPPPSPNHMTGEDIVGALRQKAHEAGGSKFDLGNEQTQAAQALRDAGVPGIKYRDAGSRGSDAASASHNYVVFDDKAIDIMKKYGLAGLGIGGGAAAGVIGQGNGQVAPQYVNSVPQGVPQLAHGGGINAALMIANRDHYARGGVAAPPNILPHALAHVQMLGAGIKRAIPMGFRPHFDDGGSTGDGGGDNSGNTDGGVGNSYGGYGYGIGSGLGAGGFSSVGAGLGGDSYTGAQSFDKSTVDGQDAYGGGSATTGTGNYHDNSYSAPSNTISRADASMAANDGPTGYSGYGGYGSSDSGSIGPSGIATGMGTGYGAPHADSTMGFGNMPGDHSIGEGGFSPNAGDSGVQSGMSNGYGDSEAGAMMSADGYQSRSMFGEGALGTTRDGPFASTVDSHAPGQFGNLDGGYGTFSAGDGTTGPQRVAAPGSLASGFGLRSAIGGNSDTSTSDSSSTDPATADGERALTVHQALLGGFGADAAGTALNGAPAIDGAGGFAANVPLGLTGPTMLGTSQQPGFDNFGLGTRGIMTASMLGLGGYTPPGWTRDAATLDMAQNYGNYDWGGKYPAADNFHPTAEGAAGMLGDNSYESQGYTLGPGQVDAMGLQGPEQGPYGPGIGIAQWSEKSRKDAFEKAFGIPRGTSDLAASNMLKGTFADQVGYQLNDIAKNYPQLAATMRSPAGLQTQLNEHALQYEHPNKDALAKSIGMRQDQANSLMGGYNASVAASQAAAQQANIGGGTLNNPDMVGGGLQQQTAPSGMPSDMPSVPTAPDASAPMQDNHFSMNADMSRDAMARDQANSVWGNTPVSMGGVMNDMGAYNNAMNAVPSNYSNMVAAQMAGNAIVNSAGTTGSSYNGGWSTPDGSPPSPLSGIPSYAPDSSLPATSPTIQTAAATTADGVPLNVHVPTQVGPSTASTPYGGQMPTPDGPTPTQLHPDQNFNPVVSTLADAALGVLAPPLGLINGVSHLVGGPDFGNLIVNNSKPGAPTSVTGTDNSTMGRNQVVGGYGGGNGYQASNGSNGQSGASSSTGTAQKAYLDALKNLPGPSTGYWKSSSVPLVAPGTGTANVYNPMTDPVVMRALALASRSSGRG